jgi:hypothetical protein
VHHDMWPVASFWLLCIRICSRGAHSQPGHRSAGGGNPRQFTLRC